MENIPLSGCEGLCLPASVVVPLLCKNYSKLLSHSTAAWALNGMAGCQMFHIGILMFLCASANPFEVHRPSNTLFLAPVPNLAISCSFVLKRFFLRQRAKNARSAGVSTYCPPPP